VPIISRHAALSAVLLRHLVAAAGRAAGGGISRGARAGRNVRRRRSGGRRYAGFGKRHRSAFGRHPGAQTAARPYRLQGLALAEEAKLALEALALGRTFTLFYGGRKVDR
jgi:hypothetical protein